MKLDTYASLEALMDADLDDAIIHASTRDLGVDVSDPPFALPATVTCHKCGYAWLPEHYLTHPCPPAPRVSGSPERPTYPGVVGPRRTPRGICAVPTGATIGTKFTTHLACPKCGGSERVVGSGRDGPQSRCLRCKRATERESQRRRRKA